MPDDELLSDVAYGVAHISPSGTEYSHVVTVDTVANPAGGLGIVLGIHKPHPPMAPAEAERAVEVPDLEVLVVVPSDVFDALRDAIAESILRSSGKVN